ncbi:hypothetical protein IAQ67_16180 [Paenibacillus peoriae]|uniref:Uncharacterized protein n=1 Tax=Paenibacillus peoriae TaxID=59893 RepID=A0A7H0Y2X3_9BACL|nr:hypothetical protein [Paenibacillus peoriae]QNR65431.1 hypothetical protein IAQ67_16180 [Paenibacillus peoriae]
MIKIKVNTNSICLKCTHFWHECGDTVQQDEYECIETCSNSDEAIQEFFEDEHEIKDCRGFEREY